MSMPSRSNGLAAEVEAVRTLALVGAAAAGKTSLAEALLYKAGAIGACGSIERGSTVSDHDPLERRMQHSLNASVMHLTHAGTRIHFIDTPGGPDFLGQSLPALEAVETAAVVINAATGIGPMAVRMMEYAASRHLARMIIVTKIDSQGVSLAGLLADIQATFGRECLPLKPARRGRQAGGGLLLQPLRAVRLRPRRSGAPRAGGAGGRGRRGLRRPLPRGRRRGSGRAARAARAGAARGPPDPGVLRLVAQRRRRGRAAGRDRQAPARPDRGQPAGLHRRRGRGGQAAWRPSPTRSLHVLAHVFKVTIDPYVGKMGIFRVHQGTLTRDSQLYIGDGRKPFKVGHLFMLQGKDHVEVSHAVPGDIVAVAKVEEIHFDAVLHDVAEDSHVHLAPLAFPVPVYGLAVEPKRHGDEQRAWEILGKLTAEDPCLRIEHVAATNETVLYGLGELHLRIVLERLREVYRFEVQTRPPRIAYRESVTVPAEGHHRHKKQTGGAGQFGEVFLRIEPLARGAGFQFADEVRGGAIPGQFIPAVEKGVREVLVCGAIAGYPVVDVRVVVLRWQAPQRRQQGHRLRDRRPQGLHGRDPRGPAGRARADRPDRDRRAGAFRRRCPSDLSSRRGLVTGTSALGGGTVAVGRQVPMAELANYQSRLNAMTSGQGRYTIALSHYEAGAAGRPADADGPVPGA